MKETEKIEIMHFDQEGYLEDGRNVYEAGKKMTALADRVHEEGYDAVFLMGVGGTWDEFMQLEYLMNKFGDRDLEVYLIHAAEWNVMGHKRMTERSVVLTASDVRHHPRGARGHRQDEGDGRARLRHDQPRGQDRPRRGRRELRHDGLRPRRRRLREGYYLADCFGLRLLNRRGCFPKFDLFIEQTRDVWKDMLDIRKRFEPRAEELARKYALADYTMFIGSGALWGETILYSMCLLEEMQWKRIRHITSHDFFHGTLELLEPGVPVFLFMGEDECRALDERVRAFLTSGVTGDEDYVIIDTAEYAIPGLDDDFRVIVSPWILSVLTTDRLARNYELVTKHNLKYRRYYHQFDY